MTISAMRAVLPRLFSARAASNICMTPRLSRASSTIAGLPTHPCRNPNFTGANPFSSSLTGKFNEGNENSQHKNSNRFKAVAVAAGVICAAASNHERLHAMDWDVESIIGIAHGTYENFSEFLIKFPQIKKITSIENDYSVGPRYNSTLIEALKQYASKSRTEIESYPEAALKALKVLLTAIAETEEFSNLNYNILHIFLMYGMDGGEHSSKLLKMLVGDNPQLLSEKAKVNIRGNTIIVSPEGVNYSSPQKECEITPVELAIAKLTRDVEELIEMHTVLFGLDDTLIESMLLQARIAQENGIYDTVLQAEKLESFIIKLSEQVLLIAEYQAAEFQQLSTKEKQSYIDGLTHELNEVIINEDGLCEFLNERGRDLHCPVDPHSPLSENTILTAALENSELSRRLTIEQRKLVYQMIVQSPQGVIQGYNIIDVALKFDRFVDNSEFLKQLFVDGLGDLGLGNQNKKVNTFLLVINTQNPETLDAFVSYCVANGIPISKHNSEPIAKLIDLVMMGDDRYKNALVQLHKQLKTCTKE